MRKNIKEGIFILGGGVTGLAAGWATRLPIFEATGSPGGICSSYYLRPKDDKRLRRPPSDGEAYRFETGGGHWIFGADREVLRFIGDPASWRRYTRDSAVFCRKEDLYIPFPIQYNLRFLKDRPRRKALSEILNAPKAESLSMKEWLGNRFGKTLSEIFFYPYNNLYTAGLYERIAPQDRRKTPYDVSKILLGTGKAVPPTGYNSSFIYPEAGLDDLTRRIAEKCRINYHKRAVRIDAKKKKICFSDGGSRSYSSLFSSLPLNKMVGMANLKIDAKPDPYTSVLVLNIGAARGRKCPDAHWLYFPESKSGFFRIGFYSNVDSSFLPLSSRTQKNRVSIYAEKSYIGGGKVSKDEAGNYAVSAIKELQKLGYIGDVETFDTNWIDVAYTWSWIGSRWRRSALRALEKNSICQIGRYGRWNFQGIADSIREGLLCKKN